MKISVVLCTYNGEKYLSEQLDSILRQTLLPFEIIIQDDCSTDNTWTIINKYVKENSFIKAYKNEINLKAHANFISAFKKVSGDYIAPSDQDDIWMDDKLEKLASAIGDNDIAISSEKILFEDGSEIFDMSIMVNTDKLIWGNNLKGHTFLFKRSLLWIYQYAGEFISFDYCLVLYANFTRKYVILNEVLSIWRRHPQVCTTAVTLNYKENIDLKSSWSKTFYTVRKIMLCEKSQAILNGLNDRSLFISKIGDSKLTKKLAKVLYFLSRQTLLSMLLSGLYNILSLRYDVKFRNYSIIFKMKSISFNFRTPFIYWYDMHNEKALE